MNITISSFFATSNGDSFAGMVRDYLDRELELSSAEYEKPEYSLRRLSVDLATDFSYFEGEWYDCMHTTLMTFNGVPADKHIVEQVGCENTLFANITKVGQNDQTLMLEQHLLNHCWFHDMGGKGQEECPNDRLPSDTRGEGNVVVKYSWKGIGSFANPSKMEFFTDHTSLKDEDGEWKINAERAKMENMDTMVCSEYKQGMVCDIRINEYRTASREITGCVTKNDGKCHPELNKKKCRKEKKKTKWSDKCVVHTPNGFVYDSFGSYYLVKDIKQCEVTCATESPTATPAPVAEKKVTGCYRGGECKGTHGCCDCSIKKAEDCVTTGENDAIFSQGCVGICIDNKPEVISGCYMGGKCNGAHGCCDCEMTEEACTAEELSFSDGCAPICK